MREKLLTHNSVDAQLLRDLDQWEVWVVDLHFPLGAASVDHPVVALLVDLVQLHATSVADRTTLLVIARLKQ